MAMRRSYTLLKDLPDVKAGAIFTIGQATDAYYPIGQATDAYYLTSDKTGTKYNCYVYPLDFVETNPEWFSPIPKESKPIQDKDFEIVSFKRFGDIMTIGQDGLYFSECRHASLSFMLNQVKENLASIESVRRIK